MRPSAKILSDWVGHVISGETLLLAKVRIYSAPRFGMKIPYGGLE